jgi:hypothetical protein
VRVFALAQRSFWSPANNRVQSKPERGAIRHIDARAGGRWFERPAAFHNSICVRFALSDWLSASIMNGALGLYVLRLAALTPRWMVLALFAAGWFPSSDLLRVWSLTGDALNQKTALINPFAQTERSLSLYISIYIARALVSGGKGIREVRAREKCVYVDGKKVGHADKRARTG